MEKIKEQRSCLQIVFSYISDNISVTSGTKRETGLSRHAYLCVRCEELCHPGSSRGESDQDGSWTIVTFGMGHVDSCPGWR